MRRAVVHVAVAAVGVALLLFAVPLAFVLRGFLLDQEWDALGVAARSAAMRADPDFASGDPIELPPHPDSVAVAVYDLGGSRRVGSGPDHADSAVTLAQRGALVETQTADELIVALPIASGEEVVGATRASEPVAVLWRRVAVAWASLVALAALAFSLAWAVARRQARVLVAPLADLAVASAAVSQGDLTARAPGSTVPEINALSQAHNAMLGELEATIRRERNFASDASHQLRTPLAGLQLELERAKDGPTDRLPELVDSVLSQVRDLHRTVEDVLGVARRHSSHATNLARRQPLRVLLTQADERWHGRLARAGRRLIVKIDPDTAECAVPGRVVTQVLDVLIENALLHGRGTVRVSGHDAVDAIAITTSDEGSFDSPPLDLFTRGTSPAGGTGIGLSLARNITEAVGGRLVLTSRNPTTFSLFLPADPVETRPSG